MEEFRDIGAERMAGREGRLCWNIRIPSPGGEAGEEITALWREAALRRLAEAKGAELSIRWEYTVTHADGEWLSFYMDMTEASGGVIRAFRRTGQLWKLNRARKKGENAALLTDIGTYLREKSPRERRVRAPLRKSGTECRYLRGGKPVAAVNSFAGAARERRFCPQIYIIETALVENVHKTDI